MSDAKEALKVRRVEQQGALRIYERTKLDAAEAEAEFLRAKAELVVAEAHLAIANTEVSTAIEVWHEELQRSQLPPASVEASAGTESGGDAQNTASARGLYLARDGRLYHMDGTPHTPPPHDAPNPQEEAGLPEGCASGELPPLTPLTDEGQDPWVWIPSSTSKLVIKRDTEFFCADGEVRQRRVDGEIGFLELDLNKIAREGHSFTHMRDWKPALEWAPYFGLTPPSHFGYRLETKVEQGGENFYRYVPTDQFIAHEPDMVAIADMSVEELEETLGSAGLGLVYDKKNEEPVS
jgi:hypothetical protein